MFGLPISVEPERVTPLPFRRELATSRSQGMVQRRQTHQTVSPTSGEREIRRWLLEWRLATTTEREQLGASWVTSATGALPVVWAPPGEGPLPVLILEYDDTGNGPRSFAISMLVEEDL